jgi:hypothetical protein
MPRAGPGAPPGPEGGARRGYDYDATAEEVDDDDPRLSR